MRRNPNGYGGITKLKGNRKNPYMAYVNKIETFGTCLPGENDTFGKETKTSINQSETKEEILSIFTEYIAEITSETPLNELKQITVDIIDTYTKKTEITAKYRKIAIGYYHTHKEAQIALAKHNERPTDLKYREVTFGEILEKAFDEKVKTEKLSSATLSTYKSSIKKVKEDIGTEPITKLTLRELQDLTDSRKSKADQSRTIVTIRLAFEYAMKNEIIAKDPSKYIKVTSAEDEKQKTVFTSEEIKTIKIESEKGDKIAQTTLILILTGMRIKECMELKTKDIQNGCIYVHGTKTKAAERIVPIHPEIKDIIRTLTKGKQQEEKLFGITCDTFRNGKFYPLMERLGMTHTVHETRHTFATITKSARLEPTLRAYIIGHSNKNITDDRYTHPEALIQDLKDEILKIKIC